MAEIVAQRGHPYDLPIGRPPLGRSERIAPEHRIERATGEFHGTERMGVPAMHGSGERQLGESHLADAPEALHERVIHHCLFLGAHQDRSVERVADFHGLSCPDVISPPPMHTLSADVPLAVGDVLHHPAFGFAVVDALEETGVALRWERPGSGHPSRVSRALLAGTYRRCASDGLLGPSVTHPEEARGLVTREPLVSLALLLLDLGGTANRDEVRDWLLDRRFLADARFDAWWATLLQLAASDPRFEARPPVVALRPGATAEILRATLATPLPVAGSLPPAGLFPFARRVAAALMEAHAAGETLVPDRDAIRLEPTRVHLPTQPGSGGTERRDDVRFVIRLVIEQLVGVLPAPADLPDTDLCCLLGAVAPTVPVEFLGVAQLALASDPELRPQDGAALLHKLAVAEAVAEVRAAASWSREAHVSVGFNSHIGTMKSLQAQTNQDAFLLVGEPGFALIAVADGISLSNAGTGDLASHLAVRSLRAHFADHAPELRAAASGRIHGFLGEALQRANRLICDQATRLAHGDPERDIPMGTTLLGALTVGNRIHLASLGDSRGYLVGPHGVAIVTADQNLQALRLRDALTGRDVVWDDPRFSLTGYLGHFTMDGKLELPPPFSRTFTLLPGEWLILATDGLTDYAAAEEAETLKVIVECIRDTRGLTPGALAMDLARRLVDAANRGGGGDNITVLALTLSSDWGAAADEPPVPS